MGFLSYITEENDMKKIKNCQYYIRKYLSKKKHIKQINLMEKLNPDVTTIMGLPLVQNMSKIDWGKIIAIPNQYIHQHILGLNYPKYHVYTTDDDDFPNEYKKQIKNNSPGYDILMIHKLYRHSIRIQSKLKQVEGVTDTSRQINIETTRRNSQKNKDKNQSGHIAYSDDEFDYMMISLINVKYNLDKRNDCNLWTYCMIKIEDIIDEDKGCCKISIPSDILKKNIINPYNCSIIL